MLAEDHHMVFHPFKHGLGYGNSGIIISYDKGVEAPVLAGTSGNYAKFAGKGLGHG